jgi:hypothetical protein
MYGPARPRCVEKMVFLILVAVFVGFARAYYPSPIAWRLGLEEASQLWGHVLDVRRDVPLMAEDVLH